MDILNDLTRCNFYYYILRSNKAYLIFKYLQLIGNDICLEDALVRKQQIKLHDNKIIRILNTDLKIQYSVLQDIKSLKLDQNLIELNKKLIDYSKLGYLLVVQYLLQPYGLNNVPNRKYEGPDIHIYNDDTLSQAAKSGNLQLVQYLVSKGANIHADDDLVLGWAVEYGYLQIVQYLLSIGANIHADNNFTLRVAAVTGHLKILQYLVQPYKLNNFLNRKYVQKGQGPSSLQPHHDVASGNSTSFKDLKNLGADIHTADSSLRNPFLRKTVLHLVAESGNLQVVQYLVSKGANIHTKNDWDLRMAATNDHLPVVQYLVSIGANSNILTTAQKLQFNIN